MTLWLKKKVVLGIIKTVIKSNNQCSSLKKLSVLSAFVGYYSPLPLFYRLLKIFRLPITHRPING